VHSGSLGGPGWFYLPYAILFADPHSGNAGHLHAALPAESYSTDTSADHPSVTFKLRKGIKFQDGMDFNAQAVKWCLDNDAKPGSSQIGQTTNWKSVEVVDDYTVRINLKTWQNTALRPLPVLQGTSFHPLLIRKMVVTGRSITWSALALSLKLNS